MATGVINKECITKTYQYTTTANSGVSPFGYYANVPIDVIPGYKPVATSILSGFGSIGIATIHWQENSLHIMTAKADTASVSVLYIRN
jgi:hypothetical protein